MSKAKQKNIEAVYPLSPMQQGMLFHSIYNPESGAYFEQFSCKLSGDLDKSAFEKAWQEVVRRHSSLRTSFVWKKLDKMLQVVHKEVSIPISEENWGDCNEAEQEQKLDKLFEHDRELGFNLSKAPLMRFYLIQLKEQTWQFLWSFHHLLTDGWSMPIILKEVFTLYETTHKGLPFQLPPARPFRDYINWIQKQDMEKAKAYWKSILKDFSSPTPLTVDRSPDMEIKIEDEYKKQKIELSKEVTQSLDKLARQNQFTINTIIQGVWALLLSRYSSEEEIVFGATVSGRPPALRGVENMVGLFINTLPMLIRVKPDISVLNWLKEIQSHAVDLREFEYTPLVEIQGWSGVPRDLPLFKSIVVFENYPVDSSMKEQKLSFEISDVRSFERTNYPITLVAGATESLILEIAYESRLFDDAAIQGMLKHLEMFLKGIAANPGQKIARLDMLTDKEVKQLTVDWNDTKVDFPQDVCVHQVFEDQVKQRPDALAVQFGDQKLTFRQLNEQINQTAHFLRKQGVGPETKVGIYLERSVEMIVSLMAVMKAGGAYVPMDPTYPLDRITFIMNDSGSSILITQNSLLDNIKHINTHILNLDKEKDNIAKESVDNPVNLTFPENLAYIIYTSGSTGRPKGTLLQHRSAVNTSLFIGKNFGILAGKRILQFASLGFDASVAEIFSAMLNGASLHLISRETMLSDTALPQLMRDEAITAVILPPSVLSIISDENLPDLEVVGSAGEACSREIVSRWQEGRHFVNGYGPTESTVSATIHHIDNEQAVPLNIPIGYPMDNAQVYILDKNLNPQPVGVPGELHIAGVGLARGYLDRPDLTADKFIPNPFSSEAGSRMYKSGDLVRTLPDGKLEFLGRIDFQVKIRGFRIELGEIESVLRDYSEIRDVVVLVREDTPGNKILASYYIPAEGAQPQVSQIQEFLKEQLPEYMAPSVLISMESFPLTSSGKINRKVFPAPDQSNIERAQEYTAPRNQTEEILCGIWSQILKIEKVGVNDNFFDLGGHSLLATQLMSRIRDAFEVELPLREFFETPTITSLAMEIEKARMKDQTLTAPPLEPVSRDGDLQLSFAQQRLWFLDQLAPNNAFYNIPGAIRLNGELNIQALEKSVHEIVIRHESLRTTFSSVKGKPVQVIHPELTINIEKTDISHLSDDEQDSQSKRLATDEAQKPFDLEKGPLVRVQLIKLQDTDHVVMFTMHHIISDGWSIGVLIEEIAALYNAFNNDQDSPLPDLPVQYVDFSAWQRQWLQGEILEKQISFWKDQLGVNPPVLELPTDFPRPSIQTFNGNTLSMTFPEDLSQRLKEYSQKQGVTLFMTLLAAFQSLLHRYSGQDDILTGSPIANRTHSETERLIGFFVNTLVLKSNFSDNPDFRTLLKRVRETTLGAYAHQDLPFEQLVEALQPDRDMSHSPLFQAAFILQNVPIGALELPGLTMSPVEAERGTAKYDLTLTTAETAHGIECHLEYNTDLFEAETIERMHQHYKILIEGILADHKQKISSLPLMTDNEIQKILIDWNQSQRAYPSNHTVHQMFEEWVEKQPQAAAVQFDSEQLTYEQLNQRANQLAHYLKVRGVDADKPVGICMHRSVDAPVSILGILKAGGAFLCIDPTYPAERIDYMLKDSGISALLTHEAVLNALPECSAQVICLDRDRGKILNQSNKNLISNTIADNLAYIIYTSGSTGKPKGTMLPHRGLCNLSKAQQKAFDIKTNSRILQFAPLSFDASVWETVMALLNGATLTLADQEMLSSGQGLIEIFRKNKINAVTLPPSVLAVVPQEPLPDLRTIVTAGEKCTSDLISRWADGRQFVNAYGPTETTVCASMFETNSNDMQAPPIGKPIDNFQLYVLDKNGRAVPVGVPGELHIGGVGLARGYLNRPGLTAEKFVPDPFSKISGSRLYRSGDLARFLPGGNIEFLGRIDYQVKVRGFRIELGEIEAALGELDAVHDVVVLARENVAGDKRLVAYLASDNGDKLDTASMRVHLKERLPEYMIPSAFVVLEAMPLTPSGKVDRKALPAPEFSRDDLAVEYAAPRNETEEKLAAITAKLLNIEKAGINDNFFELGGHSLLATQFVSRIRETFNVELPLSKLFEKPTVAEIAGQIETLAQQPAGVEIEKIERIDRGEQSLEDILANIDQLSDEEAKALLDKELNSNKGENK
jgi:amino acid adenylation domain-containing protein